MQPFLPAEWYRLGLQTRCNDIYKCAFPDTHLLLQFFFSFPLAMQLAAPVSVKWIAEFTGARLLGNKNLEATGLNEIHKVEPGDVSFVDHPKYYDRCLQSPATIIIIDTEVANFPAGKALLVCPDPFSAYVKLVQHFRPFTPASHMIAQDARIGEGTQVQPGVFVGKRVVIGQNCILHPGVVIYDDTVIGDNVVIGGNTVIGADAFYFKRRKERESQWDKLQSCGRVIIQNDVEIGAGCTIDRGVSGDTIIGLGTKIDNSVHIGHGVVIGRNCLIAAQVGIAGKTHLEDEVTLWGQVGVNKDLVIGKGAVVYAQSGVPASLAGGKVYFGSPAEEAKGKMRELAWIKRIPEIWKRITEG